MKWLIQIIVKKNGREKWFEKVVKIVVQKVVKIVVQIDVKIIIKGILVSVLLRKPKCE